MPVGASLERSDDKVRQVEEIVRAFPEVQDGVDQGRRAGQGLRGRPQPGHAEHRAWPTRSERQRSQKQVEDAIREEIAKIPGIDASRRLRPADLRGHPRQRLRRPGAHRHRVRREGEEDPRHRRRRAVGQARPAGLRGAAEARRRARARPDRAAAGVVSLRAYVNGEVATYWTTPDGEQVEVLLRLPETQRERVDQMRALPVAFAKDGTPIALDSGGRHRAGGQPRGDPPPEPAAPRGDLRRRAGPAGGRRRQRRAEAGQGHRAAAGLQLRRRRPDAGAAGGLRRDAGGDGAGGDLHLHRAGQPVRQLPAADRDHGLAAAGADRRDAGAAVVALARSTCSR